MKRGHLINEEISVYFRMVLGRGVAGKERDCYETKIVISSKKIGAFDQSSGCGLVVEIEPLQYATSSIIRSSIFI